MTALSMQRAAGNCVPIYIKQQSQKSPKGLCESSLRSTPNCRVDHVLEGLGSRPGKVGPGHSGSLSNSCHGDSQLTQELIIFKSCIHSFSRRSDSEIETGAVNVGPASSDRGTLQGSMIWAKSYSTYKTLDKSAAQLCLKVAVIIRRLWPRLWQWDSVTSWYLLLCWIWKWNFI